MGFAEEKMKMSFQTAVAKYSSNMASKDYAFKFDSDWAGFPTLNQDICNRAQNICGQMAGFLTNVSINLDNANYLMLWNAMKAQFQGFLVKHADLPNQYDYKVEIKNNLLEFTANLNTFVFSNTSSNQKTLRESIEAIL